MIQKRLRTRGNERIDEKTLKEITNFESFDKFANALLEGKVKLKDFEKINPVFKLTPPSKGFKSIKEYYPKGDLGYRGKEINELIERMI
jgi:large subunit ribosomal protein L30